MVNVDDLYVTQIKFRNPEQLTRMIEFVKSGGFFTSNSLSKYPNKGKTSPVIKLTSFEDGKLFVHDGHHRAAAIVLGGRDFLDSTEYSIKYFNYSDYTDANLDAKWWTPFDPLTEVRMPDLSAYKESIRLLFNSEPIEAVLDHIHRYRHLYSEPSERVLTLRELAEMAK